MLLGEPPRTAYDLNFRVAGIPVRVHPMFWLIGLFLGYSGGGPDAGLFMVIWVAVLFVSILIHELGHAFTMRFFGMSPHCILYWFGGLAIADSFGSMYGGRRKGNDSWNQILISFAGPAAGFIFAILIVVVLLLVGGSIDRRGLQSFDLALSMAWATPPPDSHFAFGVMVRSLLFINILWGMVNLLPVYPLDGGQIARELFVMKDPWQGITRSLWVSVFTGGAMAVFGMLYWQSIFVALMFGSLAASSYMALQQMGGGGYGGGRPW